MKKKPEDLLDFNEMIKRLDLPFTACYVAGRFLSESAFTETEWRKELEKRKII